MNFTKFVFVRVYYPVMYLYPEYYPSGKVFPIYIYDEKNIEMQIKQSRSVRG